MMKTLSFMRGFLVATFLGLLVGSGVTACSDSDTTAPTTSSSSSSAGGGEGSSSSGGGGSGQGGSGQGGAGGGSASCTLEMGLIGQWSGESDAKDSTKTADGVWTGTENYVDGKLGKAFSLDGSSFVKAPVDYTGNMTVDLWVRATEMMPPSGAAALSSADKSSDTGSLQIDSDGSGQWRLYFGFPQMFGAIDNTAFQHLAVTYDGTDSRVYLNGALVDTKGASNMALFNKALKLGVNRDGSTFLKGAIDEVHLWNRALSDKEIAELHSSPKAKLCP